MGQCCEESSSEFSRFVTREERSTSRLITRMVLHNNCGGLLDESCACESMQEYHQFIAILLPGGPLKAEGPMNAHNAVLISFL